MIEPDEIPVEVLNKNLMSRLRIELDYMREDYGSEMWEVMVQEEYDERKIEGKFRSFAEVSSQIEFDEYTSAVIVQLKKDNPTECDEMKDEYEARIWELYDEWVLGQADAVNEIRQDVEDAADAVEKEIEEEAEMNNAIEQHLGEGECIKKTLVAINKLGLDTLDMCKGQVTVDSELHIEEEEQISTATLPCICETCGAEHDGTMGSGRFCSRKCSSTFGLKKHQGKT